MQVLQDKEQASSVVSDDDEYAVESILESRAMLEGETQYLIKWKGYDNSWNTWEPENVLDGCGELLEAFKQKVCVQCLDVVS